MKEIYEKSANTLKMQLSLMNSGMLLNFSFLVHEHHIPSI
jgi:hypothetical protein